MSPIGRSVGTVSRLAESRTKVVHISRAQLLERLAEIDALLDILETHNEDVLRAERSEVAWLLGDK